MPRSSSYVVGAFCHPARRRCRRYLPMCHRRRRLRGRRCRDHRGCGRYHCCERPCRCRAPPQTTSLPPRGSTVSLPSSALITSAPLVPTSVSAPSVPAGGWPESRDRSWLAQPPAGQALPAAWPPGRPSSECEQESTQEPPGLIGIPASVSRSVLATNLPVAGAKSSIFPSVALDVLAGQPSAKVSVVA